MAHQKTRTSWWNDFKDKLKRLSDALKHLAGKAVGALLGIIGSIFGAVLNFLLKLLALQQLISGHLSPLLLVQLPPGYIVKLPVVEEKTSES